MAEPEDKIPKINPTEVELLIEKFEQNKLDEQEKKIIVRLLRTLLTMVSLLQERKVKRQRLKEMIFGKKSEKTKREEGARGEPKDGPQSRVQQGTAPQKPKSERFTEPYAVCLVIPAYEFELIEELRKRKSGQGETLLDVWVAERLKNIVQWFWYGSAKSPDFRSFLAIAGQEEQKSYNSNLALVVCLFEFMGKNSDFESGLISLRYDGILGLAGKVNRMHISGQLSGDLLGGLPLTRI